MNRFSLIVLLIVLHSSVFCQKTKQRSFSFAFYNVENLFDTIDNPHTSDNEFLPGGRRQWTTVQYQHKLYQVARVILALNEWEGPDLIGLAEIESRQVLEDLVEQTNLNKFDYGIIHKESRDVRGIDVAVLYKKNRVKVIESMFWEVRDSLDGRFRTRDILAARVQVNRDTCLFVVNHWPSRRGGRKKSEIKRIKTSNVLLDVLETEMKTAPKRKFIVTGDFNDSPADTSLQMLKQKELINLMDGMSRGTLKYRGKWNVFDQFLVSKGVLDENFVSMAVLEEGWLFTIDKDYGGNKPFRSFKGLEYIGGYSDHLPVKVELKF